MQKINLFRTLYPCEALEAEQIKRLLLRLGRSNTRNSPPHNATPEEIWETSTDIGAIKFRWQPTKQTSEVLQYISLYLHLRNMKPIQRGETSQIILTGKHSYGVEHLSIASWREGAHLYVGSFCSIAGGQRVFLGGNHRTDWGTTFPFGHIFHKAFPNGIINGGGHPSTKGHVIIENDVWIGEGCTIMSGVRIGSGSVIAAKSLVVKDVAPYSIVGGNPARHIKNRLPQHISTQLLEIKWWEKSDEDINKIVPLLQQQPSDEILAQIKEILMH